jgi:putative flippase GtrA
VAVKNVAGASQPWAGVLVERIPPRLLQFAGWFALGVVAFGAELVLLAALRQGLHYPLWLSSALAAEVILLGRFLSTDRFVFGHANPTLGRCWRFHVAAAGSFAISWLVLNGCAVFFDVHYAVAAFLGSVAAFIWSALSNFLWVWRRPAAG